MAPMIPTRRAILAGSAISAAAVISAATTALSVNAGGAHADAELLALRALWVATRTEFTAALDAKCLVDERCAARYPDYPNLSANTGTYLEYVAEKNRVTAARTAIDLDEGLFEIEAMEALTGNADTAMVERIAARPARTMAGIRFKIEVSADGDHDNGDLIASIMDDILALEAEA